MTNDFPPESAVRPGAGYAINSRILARLRAALVARAMRPRCTHRWHLADHMRPSRCPDCLESWEPGQLAERASS